VTESSAQTFHYVKSHGLGNDYLVMDPDTQPVELNPRTVRLICHRNFGIGSDGILLRTESQRGDFGLRILNPDGSEAEKSGNGARIFAKYLYDSGRAKGERFTLDTLGGIVGVEVRTEGGRATTISAAMGRASFDPLESIEVDGTSFDVTYLSVGNPHCVILVDDVEAVDLRRLGPLIETHPAFPNRTNVQFAQVLGRRAVQIVIWERGAGETLASGSSSCAVAAACYRRGLVDAEMTIVMPGGELQIQIDQQGEIQMTGPVEEVCRGTFSPEFLARLQQEAATDAGRSGQ
jgi:diaminopimelate epimerase